MIGNRGIDQDVQAKMDAYRGNPQALAQKYSQNQQLIDLLALQKLKSEKESAVREMQMKMGGGEKPTVGAQLESEVLDLTKQELAQNTSGAMQQQQAQKQQAAKSLVERSAQMPTQSPSPMTQGVAGLPANNMSPKAMAGGGIVAFEDGGFLGATEDMVPREEERRPEARPRAESLAQRGIRTLIGERTPQEVFEERRRLAQEAAGYSPAERSIIERHLKDRESIDARRFDPDRMRSEGLTRFLLGAAGRTGIGSVLAGGGAGALNYREAMDSQERAAMTDRQKQEAGLADVGRESRMAGMKLGTEAERTAMTGLAQGTGDAVKLEQLAQQAAARAGLDPNDKKIVQAYQAFNQNPEIRALLKTREAMNQSPDSPEVATINQRIYDIAAPIFRGRGLDPDLFIPRPPTPTEAPPPPPGLGSMILNALTPTFGGSGQAAPRPRSSGTVDPNNPLLRTN